MTRITRLALGGAAVTAAALLAVPGPASADDLVDEPDSFTSMFTSTATPDQVIDPEGNPAPGEPGASGIFNYRINSELEIICWDITLTGVTPPYMSMARTATHIHEVVANGSGPPRIVFPDPQDAGDGTLNSNGCMKGPFTTGLPDDAGNDTGTGFTLAEIEANAAEYYTDTHTSAYVPGAVRGQLMEVPMGGVDTGAGGTAGGGDGGGAPIVPLTLAGVAAIGGAALMIRRRSTADVDS
ncbi:MAG: CHRD domain-containing protein [Actinomycetota bacterium]|nr:CHRD domain-containing protein [Actinomycetota bacterium]